MGHSQRLNLCNAIFGISIFDYRRPSYGLLIGSGAGIMMSVMDCAPRFRYALDIDHFRGEEDRLRGWIRAVDKNKLVDLIALCGWFSITDPKCIAGALENLSAPVVIYSGGGLGREIFAKLPLVETLDELLRRVEQT